jgi:cytochrome P450
MFKMLSKTCISIRDRLEGVWEESALVSLTDYDYQNGAVTAFSYSAAQVGVEHPIALLAGLLFLAAFSVILYRLSPLHPLWHIPGPLMPRITVLNIVYHSYIGDEATWVHNLHKVYGSAVRISPNSVDFADVGVIQPIYIQKGGFLKAKYYNNFDIDGHATIFSETNLTARAARAKVVLPLFSAANIKQRAAPFKESIQRYVKLFKERRKLGSVNALDLARGAGIDAVTEYLFGIRYGALVDTEQHEKNVRSETVNSRMSASAIVDNFIASSRLWYFPVRLYDLADRIDALVFPNPSLAVSLDIVNQYADRVVEAAEEQMLRTVDKSTLINYPCRLLQAGFSRSETRAQCKDIIYAATDTIGMNLATVCFMLAKHPEAYEKLHREVYAATITTDEDIQHLPYLDGVVREALRLSLTNPARIPREVPAGGWHFQDHFYPAGTIVSASAMDIHFTDAVFDSPYAFKPERWEKSGDVMHKAMMAFGVGNRQCIARTMAMYILYLSVYELVKEDILRGAKPTVDSVKILEGFSAKIASESIDLVWN